MSAVEERTLWSLPKRIAFRFAFSYFVLFTFDPRTGWIPWRGLVAWAGPHVLGAGRDWSAGEGGISNTAYGTMLFFWYLVVAAAAAALWSILDRRRRDYARLHEAFKLLLVFLLAPAMIKYATIKIIPSQMISPLPLGVVKRPLASFATNYVLWWAIGSSTAYEIFTGCAELLGGLLLLVPRTRLVGALVCAGDMLTVFMLNVGYDVHVKLYSLHLLVMSLLLIAPHLGRLADLLIFNRRVEPAPVTPLFARRAFDRAPHILLLLFGLYRIGVDFTEARQRYEKFNPPRPPHYGVWSVERFSIDGRDVPPSPVPERWVWVTFQKAGTFSVEHLIGSTSSYSLVLWTITKPEENVLLLDGVLEGHRTQAVLRKMPLLGPRFHWVRDPEPAQEGKP